MHGGEDRRQKRLRRAGRDGDLRLRIVGAAVDRLDFARDRFAQRRDAGHRRILVVAFAHGARHSIDDPFVAIEIGEALAQVDGAAFRGERAHDREDRRADVRQTRGKGGEGRMGGFVRCIHGADFKRER